MGDGVSQAAASRVASAIAIWISRRRLNERRQVAAELHFLSAAHKAAVVIGCCWRRHRCMHLLRARLGQALARRHASLLLQTQDQASRTLQVQTPPHPLRPCRACLHLDAPGPLLQQLLRLLDWQCVEILMGGGWGLGLCVRRRPEGGGVQHDKQAPSLLQRGLCVAPWGAHLRRNDGRMLVLTVWQAAWLISRERRRMNAWVVAQKQAHFDRLRAACLVVIQAACRGRRSRITLAALRATVQARVQVTLRLQRVYRGHRVRAALASHRELVRRSLMHWDRQQKAAVPSSGALPLLAPPQVPFLS